MKQSELVKKEHFIEGNFGGERFFSLVPRPPRPAFVMQGMEAW